MSRHPDLFAFEDDFVQTLRCIPMAVRLKLDLCGVKLTLRQWSRFTVADRRDLLDRRCGDAAAIAALRAELLDLVSRRTGEGVRFLTEPCAREWDDPAAVPAQLAGFARARGLPPPSPTAWQALRPLQRFALLKLSRDNHDNVNFAPALREFGLV